MALRPTITRSAQLSGPLLTVSELKAKTAWIRDSLEPTVARHGSRNLAPDTVLELNSFFHTLLDLSRLPDQTRRPSITNEALQISRIHRAIVLVAGRGTRWPGRLIEVCDELIKDWTEKFGNLEMIRPLLYEKGGRLEMMKEERDMGRHELMIKWMSDPNSMVSPLRALESGHLEFKPGQWWIHPLFAFHAGIIDSPDPHGGISADSDGAYAILLTCYDEVASETPESFTYRCRNDDQGRFRLLGAILPPRSSVRILRSHTLHSMWSPPAGVRYDGLYRITKWSLRRVNNELSYEVTFQREMDQVSMREARLHPTAEEIDDYIEYKRLREESHERQDAERRDGLPGHEKIEEKEEYNEEEQEVVGEEGRDNISEITIKPGKYSSTWDDSASPFSTTKEEINPFRTTGGLSPSRSRPRHSLDPVLTVSPTGRTSANMFDGAASEARGSVSSTGSGGGSPVATRRSTKRPSMASTTSLERIRYCCNMTEAEIRDDQISWIRRDSAHWSRGGAGGGSKPTTPRKFRQSLVGISESGGDSAYNTRSNSIVPYAPDHKTLHGLASNVRDLRDVTLRKDSVGSTFMDDLKAMREIVTHWQVESAETNGYVDQCLKALEGDIDVMKEHGKFDWLGFAREGRRVSPVEELEVLEGYKRRYEERRREEMEREGCGGVGEGDGEGGLGTGGMGAEGEVGEKEVVWTLGVDVLLN